MSLYAKNMECYIGHASNREFLSKTSEIKDMTQRKAETLLAALITARSTSFLFSKIGLDGLGIFNLIALRYLIAFVILALVFHKKMKAVRVSTLLHSAVLAGIFFALLTAELSSLQRTDASTTAFLENSAIVFVPVFHAVLTRKMPKGATVISSLVALCGVFCLTLKNGFSGFGPGQLFGILAAMLYAAYILVTAHFGDHEDTFQIGVLQNGFLGLYGLIAAAVAETPHLPANGAQWISILGLAVICSAFGLTLQPVAQSHTTAERAGLFCAISPVSAALLSCFFLGENLGTTGILGGALIMASIFIPKLHLRAAEG